MKRPPLPVVANRLREGIKSLPAGTALPTRDDLASEHGTSVRTIWRALNVLRSEGLVVSDGTNRGWRTVNPGEPPKPDMRALVGALAVRTAPGRLLPTIRELVARHGVGRGEISRIYRALAEQGLVIPAGRDRWARAGAKPPRSRHEHAVRALRTLPAGSVIESMHRFAAAHDVGLGTVARAIEDLHTEGLVTKRNGHWIRVDAAE